MRRHISIASVNLQKVFCVYKNGIWKSDTSLNVGLSSSLLGILMSHQRWASIVDAKCTVHSMNNVGRNFSCVCEWLENIIRLRSARVHFFLFMRYKAYGDEARWRGVVRVNHNRRSLDCIATWYHHDFQLELKLSQIGAHVRVILLSLKSLPLRAHVFRYMNARTSRPSPFATYNIQSVYLHLYRGSPDFNPSRSFMVLFNRPSFVFVIALCLSFVNGDLLSDILTAIENAVDCASCHALVVPLQVLAHLGNSDFVSLITDICTDLGVSFALSFRWCTSEARG